MSYAIRNTLLLLLALILIYGAGYAYMHYFQKAEIEELEVRVVNLENQLNQDSQTADMVPMLREQYEQSRDFIENYDKSIFRNNNPDEVFRFLSLLNRMSDLDFSYVFRDSSVTADYGIISSEISGIGTYSGLMRFVNAIENSEPVQKINDVTISPLGSPGEFQVVNFNFNLQSKYDSQRIFNLDRTPGISTRAVASAHNPFFPLIRTPDPNVDNLVEVDNSRLIGMTPSAVYLRDQDGQMVTLRPNDRVYLGRLETIDAQRGRVTFRLNRGGIIDVVTLEVQR